MIMTTTKNLKRVSFLRQAGPKVEEGKVTVYKDGTTLRISEDFVKQMIGKRKTDQIPLIAFVDKKGKKLVLQYDGTGTEKSVLRTWKSSPRAKSVLISIAGLLQVLGISEKDAPGTYDAEIEDDSLVINF